LLDGGKLKGSFFKRTVVLVCQHNAEGAFGVVVNRETEISVGDMIPEGLPDRVKKERLYLGGPVQPSALSFLHSDEALADANVMHNLNLGHSLETLIELGQDLLLTQRLRVFAGYAGWSPGQLENELKQRAWLVHPASLDLVFSDHPTDLWGSILRQKGWQYELLADGPEDLSWN